MTRDQAVETAKTVNNLTARLAAEYPCEACEGLGYQDDCCGDLHPCRECFGKGWAMPSEEEEDE